MPLIGLDFFIETTTPSSVPEQVDNVTVERGVLSSILSWTPPELDQNSSYAGVKIVRKEGSCPTSMSDGTTIYEGNATTYTDSGLVEGTTYYYRFFAYDSAKNYQTSMRYVSTTAFTGYKWNRYYSYSVSTNGYSASDTGYDADPYNLYVINIYKDISYNGSKWSSTAYTYTSPQEFNNGSKYEGYFIYVGGYFYKIQSHTSASVQGFGPYTIVFSGVLMVTGGKGAFIDTVSGNDINAYPASGYSGGYYYELIGS